MLTPHKMRELVFHLLYSADFSGDQEGIIPFLMEQHKVTKKSVCQAKLIAEAVQAKQAEIDEMIAKTATSYDFDRILGVEKNLLRLGIFELFFSDTIPPKVAISEAMRLATKFGSSATFINAILDNLYKQKTNGP
jgi:transcription antitermination protein NusB